jgi:hypothetical protein
MAVRVALILAGLLSAHYSAYAATPKQIADDNANAVVYIEIDDSNGKLVDSGSGVIVSHDGWIVTAAHLKPQTPSQSMLAVVGERGGTRYKLEFRDIDETFDVALWQLPQSKTCRHAATLSSAQVEQLDRVLVMGFPGTRGLTPTPSSITNLHGDLGFYKADGFLEGGNSGGPVFNELGHVVATVQGGTLPGTENNDLVPIGPAISLLRKHNVAVGVDTPVPYANSCYATCQTNAVDHWSAQTPWSADTGEFPGGHSPVPECTSLISQYLVNKTGVQIVLLPGEAGASGTVKKDLVGQVHYTFHCHGTLFSGPVYKVERSPSCGLFE